MLTCFQTRAGYSNTVPSNVYTNNGLFNKKKKFINYVYISSSEISYRTIIMEFFILLFSSYFQSCY